MQKLILTLLLSYSLAQNVTLPSGTKLIGRACPDNTALRCFFGVPFAEPPTGDNRFRPPVPYNYTESEITVQNHGSKCYQGSGGSEDCLYMDIYAPAENVTIKSVMVWLHGGCFTSGSAVNYQGQDLATTGDVLVVTL